jgi:hypothetical protein
MAVPRNQVAISGFVDPYAKLSGTFKDLSSMYAGKAAKDQELRLKEQALARQTANDMLEADRFRQQQGLREDTFRANKKNNERSNDRQDKQLAISQANSDRAGARERELTVSNTFYDDLAVNLPDIDKSVQNAWAVTHLQGVTPDILAGDKGDDIRGIAKEYMSPTDRVRGYQNIYSELKGKGNIPFDPQRVSHLITKDTIEKRQARANKEFEHKQSRIDKKTALAIQMYNATKPGRSTAGGGKSRSKATALIDYNVSDAVKGFSSGNLLTNLGGGINSHMENAMDQGQALKDSLVNNKTVQSDPAMGVFILDSFLGENSTGADLTKFDGMSKPEQGAFVNKKIKEYEDAVAAYSYGGTSAKALIDSISAERGGSLSIPDVRAKDLSDANTAYEKLMGRLAQSSAVTVPSNTTGSLTDSDVFSSIGAGSSNSAPSVDAGSDTTGAPATQQSVLVDPPKRYGASLDTILGVPARETANLVNRTLLDPARGSFSRARAAGNVDVALSRRGKSLANISIADLTIALPNASPEDAKAIKAEISNKVRAAHERAVANGVIPR